MFLSPEMKAPDYGANIYSVKVSLRNKTLFFELLSVSNLP
jgi:hypothetical protein